MDPLQKIDRLERQMYRMRLAFLSLILIAGAVIITSMQPQAEVLEEVRTKRVVVVDDEGVARVVIGQDPKDTQRRSRSAGITIHDKTGSERGGLGTFEDGSVVMALDAPSGVGNPMRDRIGMGVWPDGSSHLILLDNQTKGVVKLYSDGTEKGGVQVFAWDDSARVVSTKTITFAGEEVEQEKYGSW